MIFSLFVLWCQHVWRVCEPTAECAIHAATTVQQVMSQAGRLRQAEKISQVTGGETRVLCPFPHVNHGSRESLFGHLSLKYTLLNGA